MAEEKQEQTQGPEMPVTVLAQYIRDVSFENPHATDILRGAGALPEMDINIGMDARKIPDENSDSLYEVVLNLRAVAKRQELTIFIAELQYGITVIISDEVPEDNHHPLLLIEIPRLAFPFARQIMANLTQQGGYPPLLLNPVDFHALYMQRFGKEIEEARRQFEAEQQA
ncbi:MAG: protein-export chaperone SecB [Alphaproteobacteria bacterium]|nr:protein-export chaperone SecB [Alphaproteobacteria bacterium]